MDDEIELILKKVYNELNDLSCTFDGDMKDEIVVNDKHDLVYMLSELKYSLIKGEDSILYIRDKIRDLNKIIKDEDD